MLRTAFKLPLRQAEGLLTSVVEFLGCELAVPDHTTVSRRAIKLPWIARAALTEGPLHVGIDSTGLKVYGAGEWLADKHARRAPQYRKLHLAVDADSGQIVAVTLTARTWTTRRRSSRCSNRSRARSGGWAGNRSAATAAARWSRPRWGATRRSSARGWARATKPAAAPKRQWAPRCSTVCWRPHARTASAAPVALPEIVG